MFQVVKIASVIGLSVLAAAGSAAQASPVTWASLTSDDSAAGTVSGSIGAVGVIYSGGYSFAELNETGFNYWGAVPVTSSDIIALNDAGTGTLTFSAPVTNVFVAFDSWNGANVTFSAPFTIVSTNCSYWGCGTFVPNITSTGFTGSGETAGVLEFAGTFTSLSFTDTVTENWHGLTIGIGGPAVAGVPEPASWAMMLIGMGAIGFAARRRASVNVSYA